MKKICTQCKVERPYSDFSPRRDRPGKFLSRCKICDNLASKDWYQRNREEHLANKRARWAEEGLRIKRHGLTVEQYEVLHTLQEGKCAWCGRTEGQVGEELCIDHDPECCPGQYSCGQCVRRLLCRTCNTIEGQLKQIWPKGLRLLESEAHFK